MRYACGTRAYAFHVVRLRFAAVDEVRRPIQRKDTGHRGRRDDLLVTISR